jgi:diaminohydroxyphosphoribosylaminopyrimidine deaminase/5-amino-6-(5-phosphoribosylamino)uracil reductase
MLQALALAARGVGRTGPNPPVGAVVVRHRRVVGRGYHRGAGTPHAEVLALRQAGARSRGATLYITLEPCCHLDKLTPPCVPLIVAKRLRRVVIATTDPNPKVRGRGVAALRRGGISVTSGVGRAEADALIEPYRVRMLSGRPFVTLKIACTLDGKIATARGESRWITGIRSRQAVQRLRSRTDAILVGIGTVLADDPSLTVRGRGRMRCPLRIVLDPRLRIPPKAKLLTDGRAPTLLIATSLAPKASRSALRYHGAEILVLPDRNGRIKWSQLLNALGRRGISSLLIEGGAEVNASVLGEGAVNRVVLFIAPRLLGGRDAIGAIGGVSPTRLVDALMLRHITVRRIGSDIMVEGRLN